MRKSNVINLSDRGRDLAFRIQEMSALETADWVEQALMMLGSTGLSLPEGAGISYLVELISQDGGATVLITSLLKADHKRARPLFMDLLGCCYLQLGKMEVRMTEDTVNDHVEDWTTIERLRIEALKQNLGFTRGAGGGLSGSLEASAGGRA